MSFFLNVILQIKNHLLGVRKKPLYTVTYGFERGERLVKYRAFKVRATNIVKFKKIDSLFIYLVRFYFKTPFFKKGLMVLLLFFTSFVSADELSCSNILDLKAVTGLRSESFLRSIRRTSKEQPHGVELEIDVESVFEEITFSPRFLESLAVFFTTSNYLQDFLIKALKDEATLSLFDVDDRVEMREIVRKWIRLARETNKGVNLKKLEDLQSSFSEEDSLAATVLKLTMLKAFSYLNQRFEMAKISKEIQETLFKHLPDLRVEDSKMRVQFARLGLMPFAIEQVLRVYAPKFIESAGYSEYEELANKISTWKNHDSDRNIHGVTFNDPAHLSDTDPGVSAPGELIFYSHIEDRSPIVTTPQLTSGIEIHAISSSTPSKTKALVARRLKEIAETPSLYTSLHVHITAPLKAPSRDQRTSPLNPMLIRIEHGRRLEMLAHMVQVVENEQAVEVSGESFSPMGIKSVIDFFKGFPEYWYLNKKENYINRDRAFGYVSFTGPGNYKDISEDKTAIDLFGYEFRFLDPELDPNNLIHILDDAKWFLHQFNSLSNKDSLPERFQKYFDKFLKTRLKEVAVGGKGRSIRGIPFDLSVSYAASLHAARAMFEAAYYLGPLHPLKDKGFFDTDHYQNLFSFERELSEKMRKELVRDFPSRSNENSYEIGFIFHNWGRDPLLFDNQKLLAKIRGAQRKAKNRLKGEDSTVNIVRDFLIETKIYDIYRNSIRSID